MKQVDIIFFDVTSGHRTAAFAIKKALQLQDPSLKIRVLNLIDVLKHQPILQTLARIGVDVCNWGVKREKAWFLRQQIGTFQMIQSHVPEVAIQQVAEFWRDTTPDVVVSVLPICNWLLERALHRVCPECPYLIIPVDFEESKANYWFDRRMDAYYINPTPMLGQQCAELGIDESRAISVKGMPIDPMFYEKPAFDKRTTLQELGLNPDLPTILVGFGGQGSVLVKQCAQKLAQDAVAVNVIFLCGRHKALYDELSSLKTPYPKLVLSFTPEPPAYYYHLADIVVGKPGSMTITEAIITHTALLAVEAQSLAMVQRGNEAWVRQSGVGEVIQIQDLPQAIQRVLTANTANENLKREWHQGVFDIASIVHNFAYGVEHTIKDMA